MYLVYGNKYRIYFSKAHNKTNKIKKNNIQSVTFKKKHKFGSYFNNDSSQQKSSYATGFYVKNSMGLYNITTKFYKITRGVKNTTILNSSCISGIKRDKTILYAVILVS